MSWQQMEAKVVEATSVAPSAASTGKSTTVKAFTPQRLNRTAPKLSTFFMTGDMMVG